MATMTVSEACYVAFDIVAAELKGGCHGHLHHPVSALKGYDIVQICTAFKLLVASEFLFYRCLGQMTESDEYEEKFTEGVKLYEVFPLHLVGPSFVADDEVDVLIPKPAFEFDDPRFLSQETASSFAEYCRSLGANDSMYWQKVYTRLGLEYTSTSPRGNQLVVLTSESYLRGLEWVQSVRNWTASAIGIAALLEVWLVCGGELPDIGWWPVLVGCIAVQMIALRVRFFSGDPPP
jgi:hypothetical protein